MLLKQREKVEGEGMRMQDIPTWGVPFSPEPDLEPASWIARILQRLPRFPLLGAGVNMAWYVVELRRLAEASMRNDESASELPEMEKYGFKFNHSLGPVGAIFWMWAWFDEITLHRMCVLAVWSLIFFWNWLLCR